MYKFSFENQLRGKNFTFLNFKTEKTIYRIIQRAENKLGFIRRNGSGRKPKITDIKGKRKLKVMFDLIDQT